MIHFINIKKTFQQTKMMNLSLQMKANKNDSRHSAMRLITIFLCVILSLCTEVHADNITPKEALQIAKRYVRVDKKTQRKILTRTSSASQSSFSQKQGTTPYYIYNDSKGNGFVIVAGNDAMGQVLAYNHEGVIDTTRLNPEVAYLLHEYRQVYKELNSNQKLSTAAAVSQSIASKNEVKPLLHSHWSQEEPYNKYTGYYTGCVATAVAQVMFYHKWPLVGRGQHTYITRIDQRQRSADFSKSTYQWLNMDNDYRYGQYNETQANAVAHLMSDVGIAVNMQYSPNGSGTQDGNALNALREYFNYDATIITKADEGPYHFTEIIKNELRNGFPLYISGSPGGGRSGHAWVADGFDRDDLIHMNFGWGGNADGYYSLKALNLTTSGKEFSGRALSFGKQLVIILAHPNKEGVAKIDYNLREDAPNIAFNSEADMHFVGNEPTALEKCQIAYKNFTNQSTTPFQGDFGIGIYDEKGKSIAVFPSDTHDKGGYTKEYFKANEGKIVSGGLVFQDINFTIDLTQLTDGLYSLSPIACTRKDDGEWGKWVKIKKAPRYVFEVKEGKIIYREKPSVDASFQFATMPTTDGKLQTGSEAKLHLAIRKLFARPFDGKIRLDFLDANNQSVYTHTTKSVDFEDFVATRLTLTLSLPDDLPSGRYRLRATIINDYGDETCQVRDANQNEPWYVEVAKVERPKELLSDVIGFVQNNAEESIEGLNIDVKREGLIKVGCVIYANKNVDYNGSITLTLVDSKTNEHISLPSYPKTINLAKASDGFTITSGWLKASDIKLINHHLYRLALIANIDGEEQDLLPRKATPLLVSIINGPNNDVPNAIDELHTTSQMRYAEGQLEIIQTGLKYVDIYTMNGLHLLHKAAAERNRIAFPLAPSAYIIKVTTDKGCYTKKLLGN